VNDAQLLADRFEEHRGRLEAVAYRMLGQAMLFRRFALDAHFAMINGEVGVVGVHDGRPMSVMGVTVTGGRITGMYILADPERLARLDLPDLTG
jgi:RNA polymerase sigma-70 factor (ECF subfamily)